MKHEGFTPGPWTIEYGTAVMGVRRSVGFKAGVATCGGFSTNTDGGRYVDESAANARLIADAPRLYAENQRLREALKQINAMGESTVFSVSREVMDGNRAFMDGANVAFVQAAEIAYDALNPQRGNHD